MKALEYFKSNYRQFLPTDKTAKILDFGCGSGNVLKFLQNSGYSKVQGSDIYSHEEWLNSELSKIQITKIDDTVQYLQSIKAEYDFIIVKDVIYYFKNEEVVDIIKLIKQALKPGGKILFEIFNGSTLTGPFVQYKDVDIKQILTEHSITTLMKRGGLKLDHIKGNVIPITGLGSIIYLLVNSIQKLWLRLLYFSERGIDSQNPKILSKKIIVLASSE